MDKHVVIISKMKIKQMYLITISHNWDSIWLVKLTLIIMSKKTIKQYVIQSFKWRHWKRSSNENTRTKYKLSRFRQYLCKDSYIAKALCHIINLIFHTGFVTTHFKQSITVPIHKTGLQLEESNYRPMSGR